MSNLYIVATPIGNLEDITLRALRVLKEVDAILCEDTRQTKKLLDKYAVGTRMISYHQHSKLEKIETIAGLLKENKNLALVSDAGTPGISDPGNKLVEYLVKSGIDIKVVPIPGPSGVAAALSVCGFSADEFVFLGFVPHKKGRQTFFKNISREERTSIFYESPHRIIKTLNSLAEFAPQKEIAVCRELTKIYETIYRGKAEDILKKITPEEVRGEFIVVVR